MTPRSRRWAASSTRSCGAAFPLPAVEVVTTSTLTSPKGETDQPDDREDDRSDPQQVHGETGAEENQDEQQCKYQNHGLVTSQRRFTPNLVDEKTTFTPVERR